MRITRYNEDWFNKVASLQLDDKYNYNLTLEEVNKLFELLELTPGDPLEGTQLNKEQIHFVTHPRTYFKVIDCYDVEPEHYTLVVEAIQIESAKDLTYMGCYQLNLMNADELELDPVADAQFIKNILREDVSFMDLRKDFVPKNFNIKLFINCYLTNWEHEE